MWWVLGKVPSGFRFVFAQPPMHPHTHTCSTLQSTGTYAYFIATFVQERKSGLESNVKSCEFFRRGRVIFLWGWKCRDISVPYAKGDLPLCHALTRGTKFSHYSEPPCPAKCCHLSSCVHCIFLTPWHRPPCWNQDEVIMAVSVSMAHAASFYSASHLSKTFLSFWLSRGTRPQCVCS